MPFHTLQRDLKLLSTSMYSLDPKEIQAVFATAGSFKALAQASYLGRDRLTVAIDVWILSESGRCVSLRIPGIVPDDAAIGCDREGLLMGRFPKQ